MDFPKTESDVLKMWSDNDTFNKSIIKNAQKPDYFFMDGPIFASGLPHYGHILTGTVKDVVTRYAHQTDHNVERRFGTDDHGIPVEAIINKKLDIKSRSDLMKIGIKAYNEECRNSVLSCIDAWSKTTSKTGRWISFENDYKTMSSEYMESEWSIFKRIFDLGLVYRSFRVMPFSTKLGTPISNHEMSQDSYKTVNDVSAYVSFKIKNEQISEYLVAYTTTPWTLVSNLALCVNSDMLYIKVRSESKDKIYYVAQDIVNNVFKEFEVIGDPIFGRELVGLSYEPLFDFFKGPTYFKVIADPFVNSVTGTGIVHIAPAFGEDDFRVSILYGIVTADKIPCPVTDEGFYTSEITGDLKDLYVKDKQTDLTVCRILSEKNLLVKRSMISHSVPFCTRTGTPLIYKAVNSWFIKVSSTSDKFDDGKRSVRDIMVDLNKEIRWVPDHVGSSRFHEWISNSRDWNISRNRYWGTPIPIWSNEDSSEIVVIGSIAELEELSGISANGLRDNANGLRDNANGLHDLHKEFIDHIEIPSKNGGPPLKRIPEVFDCWFDSGCVPYASQGYMYSENKRPKNFPADFVSEGIDQTRGWWHVLLVISTALFKEVPFKNVIACGIVLAEDGRKMSKSLQNYPKPETIIEKYGADALRLYLIGSPAVRAEPLRFSENAVLETLKNVLIPWSNALRFYQQNKNQSNITGVTLQSNITGVTLQSNITGVTLQSNIMDKWILAEFKDLVNFTRTEMDKYQLFNVVGRLVKFVDLLTNWYVRLNRDRIKDHNEVASNVLYEILYNYSILMSPFVPFFSEFTFQELRRNLNDFHSVHFESIQKTEFLTSDEIQILEMVRTLQNTVQLGRLARDTVKIKRPLKRIIIITENLLIRDNLQKMSEYLQTELNTLSVEFTTDRENKFSQMSVIVNDKELGLRFKKERISMKKAIMLIDPDQLYSELKQNGFVKVNGHQITELTISRVPITNITGSFGSGYDKNHIVIADLVEEPELIMMSLTREIKSIVQKQRKNTGLVASDPRGVYLCIRRSFRDFDTNRTCSELMREALKIADNYHDFNDFNNAVEFIESTLINEEVGEDIFVDVYITKT